MPIPRQHSTIRVLIVAIAALTLLVLIGGLILRKRTLTLSEFRRVTETQLPIGSSKDDVLRFLDGRPFGRKVEHSGYDPRDHSIEAIMRRTRPGLLTYASIQAEFQFDAEGRLREIVAREVFTGP
jgi:hypothetical protein